MWRRLLGPAIALGLVLPAIGSAQTVCSATAQSQATCSTIPASETPTSQCECVSAVTPAGPFGGHATLTDGLVSYWALDEESGTRVDSVGSNDLTDNNTVGFTSVTPPPDFPAGKTATFVRANAESLSRSTQTITPSGSARSVSFWFRNPTVDGNAFSLVTVAATIASGDRLFSVYTGGTSPNGTISLHSNGSATNSAGFFASSTWQFVVYTFDGIDAHRVYVNDTQRVTRTQAEGGASSVFVLGDSAAGPWNGEISNVGVWNRVLTAQERSDLYASGNGLFYGSN